jgi:hypothetical protein
MDPRRFGGRSMLALCLLESSDNLKDAGIILLCDICVPPQVAQEGILKTMAKEDRKKSMVLRKET